jgi:hypothetical protein
VTIHEIKRRFLITMLTIIGCACVLFGFAFILVDSSSRLFDSAGLGAVIGGYLLVVALACFATLERGRFRWVAVAGLLATSLGVIIVPLFIWFSQSRYPYSPAWYQWRRIWEALFATYFLSVGYLGLMPLVLLPRLKGVSRLVQLGTVGSMTAALILMMLASCDVFSGSTGNFVGRMIAASLIFSGGGGLCVYVLNRFFTAKTPQQLEGDPQMLHIRCPRCLVEQEVSVGESNCAHCKLRFKIDVEEPRCGNCHYLLRGLTRPICPECGTVFRHEELADQIG